MSGKVIGKKVDCLKRHVRPAGALNNLHCVIDNLTSIKRVFSTTCDSSTDAVSDCLNADRMRKSFVVTSFFLVAAVA